MPTCHGRLRCSQPARWRMTWCMPQRRPRSCAGRRIMAPRAAPTGWACWSSRRRCNSTCGAASCPRPVQCWRNCARKSRPEVKKRALLWFTRGLAVVVGLFLCVQLWFFLQVVNYKYRAPGETAFMSYRLSGLPDKNPWVQLQYRWVPYSHISVHLKRALIAAEDAKFVEHEGFDWDGIQVALDKNWKRGKTVAGGSTITQQLAKNLFLSPSKSYTRKAE